jgi:large subunit ribosomal protein L31
MKADIHPKNYRMVLFVDVTSGQEFICGSTLDVKDTAVAKTDGKEYPLLLHTRSTPVKRLCSTLQDA